MDTLQSSSNQESSTLINNSSNFNSNISHDVSFREGMQNHSLSTNSTSADHSSNQIFNSNSANYNLIGNLNNHQQQSSMISLSPNPNMMGNMGNISSQSSQLPSSTSPTLATVSHGINGASELTQSSGNNSVHDQASTGSTMGVIQGVPNNFLANMPSLNQGPNPSGLGAPLLQSHNGLKPPQPPAQIHINQHHSGAGDINSGNRMNPISMTNNPLLNAMGGNPNTQNMGLTFSNGIVNSNQQQQQMNVPKSLNMPSGPIPTQNQSHPMMNGQYMTMTNNTSNNLSNQQGLGMMTNNSNTQGHPSGAMGMGGGGNSGVNQTNLGGIAPGSINMNMMNPIVSGQQQQGVISGQQSSQGMTMNMGMGMVGNAATGAHGLRMPSAYNHTLNSIPNNNNNANNNTMTNNMNGINTQNMSIINPNSQQSVNMGGNNQGLTPISSSPLMNSMNMSMQQQQQQQSGNNMNNIGGIPLGNSQSNMTMGGNNNNNNNNNSNNQHTMNFISNNNNNIQQQQQQQQQMNPTAQMMLQQNQIRSLPQAQVQVQMQPKQGNMSNMSMNSMRSGNGNMSNMVTMDQMNNNSNQNNNQNSQQQQQHQQQQQQQHTMNSMNGLQQSNQMGVNADNSFPPQRMLLSQSVPIANANNPQLQASQQPVMLSRVGQGMSGVNPANLSVTVTGQSVGGLNGGNLLIQPPNLTANNPHMTANTLTMGGMQPNQMQGNPQQGGMNAQGQAILGGNRTVTIQGMPGNLNQQQQSMGVGPGMHTQGAGGQIAPQQMTSTGAFGGVKQTKKPWHTPDHSNDRIHMVQRIVTLLQQRRPNATPDWHQKLPQMAKRLEDALYGTANSFDEYNDVNTLKTRLQHLALSMGSSSKANNNPGNSSNNTGNNPGNNMNLNKKDGMQPVQGQPQQSFMQGQMGNTAQQQGNMITLHGQQGFQPNMQPPQNMQQSNMSQTYPHNSGMNTQLAGGQMQNNNMSPFTMNGNIDSNNNNTNNTNMMLTGMSNSQLQNQMNMQMQQQPQQSLGMNIAVVAGGMNVGMGGGGMNSNGQFNMMGSGQVDQQSLMQTPVNAMAQDSRGRNMGLGENHNMMGGYQNQMSGQGGNNQQQQQQQPRQFINMAQINPLISHPTPNMPDNKDFQPNMQQNNNQSQSADDNQSMGKQRSQPPHTEEHRRQVLKQQQQRLLLLRHASKCPHDNGRCPVTPHCAGMKQLWKHIMSCKDQECKVAHCVSSRYVLSHYSKCKEQNCPVCGPVREAIRRNYDRSRQILNMSKPQQAGAGHDQFQVQGGPIPLPGQMGGDGQSNHLQNGMERPLLEQPVPKRRERGERMKDSTGDLSQASTAVVIAPPQQLIPQRTKPSQQLDPISCALYSFTTEMIQEHMKHVVDGQMTAGVVKAHCMPLINEFMDRPGGNIYSEPVDPVKLHIPDYFDIIKHPMDLGTVKKRLECNYYRSIEEFGADVQLTFDNAMLYNPKTLDVHQIAKTFRREFDLALKQKLQAIERETEENKRKSNDHCLLCGETNLKFEPPVYYCNGRCSQRIRRSAFFYSTQNNAFHWCIPCFSDLKENQPIQIGESTIFKRDLNKKKHIEESEEPWVQCDICQRWVHQVCTLFNGRRNFSDAVGFVCPNCILKRRDKKGEGSLNTKRRMQAADLPHCKLTQFLEDRVYARLEQAYKERAEKYPNLPDQKCPPVYVRQVSALDKMQAVRDGVYNRYKHKNYPQEFPCRTKCITLFQTIDGQDVILFGMYVYEYGHKCPLPNQRRVYISYLDSVHYFRPRFYRTIVYHEILIAYLEYVKNRGFHTAHIWACPPLKGDDYILYCHPQDQKTPKDDRLRHWYADMLKICQQRGIVESMSDLYTEFMKDEANDATVLPYFEGDYWVNEAEVIITNLGAKGAMGSVVEEEEDENEVVPGTHKRKSTSKSKRTRSSKGIIVSKSERDPVMAKLAAIIEPMKEAFFVAKLLPDEFAKNCAKCLKSETDSSNNDPEQERKRARLLQEEALVSASVSTEVTVARKKAPENNNTIEMPADESDANQGNQTTDENSTEMSQAEADLEQDTNNAFDAMASAIAEGNNSSPDGDSSGNEATGGDATAETVSVSDGTSTKEEPAKMVIIQPNELTLAADSVKTEPVPESREDSTKVKTENNRSTSKGIAIMRSQSIGGIPNEPTDTSRKIERSVSDSFRGGSKGRSSLGSAESKAEETKGAADSGSNQVSKSRTDLMYNPDGTVIDETEDPDDIQECEFFDTRQAFLNLCQGNHYQFDQLRRAKHTSMMVLYHLHNPDAPKFVAVCVSCTREILTGIRYHCEPCMVDVCEDCFAQQGAKVHAHPMVAMQVSSGNQVTQLTEQQRAERNRSIKLHLELLHHASYCEAPECTKNCRKMKDFLKHEATCQTTMKRGCPTCKRIYNLLTHHARGCRTENCAVLRCKEIRENFRQITMQQQQMDDRRRTMMNETFGRGAGGGTTMTTQSQED